MRRSIAFSLSSSVVVSAIVAGAMNARAENPPPRPPLDVSGWYLRGNVDDPAQRGVEGQSYLQPNIVRDLTSGAGGPAHYSMSETR